MIPSARPVGHLLVVLGVVVASSGCREAAVPLSIAGRGGASDRGHDPLAVARAQAGVVGNLDAAIPPMCYTRTDGTSNPCWVCHTDGRGRTRIDDGELQETYAFPDSARTNPWRNLFVDRRAAIAAIDDAEILAWVRTDNYRPLVAAMARAPASSSAALRPGAARS